METEAMRKELLTLIERGDNTLLEAIYEVVKDYNESFELSEEELKELDRRRERYLSGESKSYTWEEAKEIIRQNRKVK